MAAPFSSRLKDLRKKKGQKVYTLQKVCNDVSELTGKKIPISTYSTWEIGKSEPNLDLITALSRYYNVSTDYLLGVDIESSETVQQLPADLRRLVRIMRALTPKLQREMREIVESILEKRGELPQKSSPTTDDLLKVCDEALDLINVIKVSNPGDGSGTVNRIQFNTLQNMSLTLELKGLFKEALSIKENLLTGLNDENSTQNRLCLLKETGVLYFRMGQFSAAIQYFTEALELARSTANIIEENACLNNIGWVYSEMGDLREA
ncbi:MAG: hypothetical protein A2161_01660, partial [Candidatus Schekmanbacteria bacterium RBG_13_48_7]